MKSLLYDDDDLDDQELSTDLLAQDIKIRCFNNGRLVMDFLEVLCPDAALRQ